MKTLAKISESDPLLNLLIFPHQLFENHPGLDNAPDRVVLIEASLFFGDSVYPAKFHKQKLWLHRASMKRYEGMLQDKGFATKYVRYDAEPDSLFKSLKRLQKSKSNGHFFCAEPVDFILEKRLARAMDRLESHCDFLPSPQFINSAQQNLEYRQTKKRWFMADFYKFQRIRLDALVEDGEPVGGKWSFDSDNRKKVPKKRLGDIPANLELKRDQFDSEAIEYVNSHFPNNPGSLNALFYPTSHAVANKWLKHFLKTRLEDFGPYEDAIVENESWLWHSVLTPALNIGLLTPRDVLSQTLAHAKKNDVPLNSLEGFIRQIIGWREFMRATYQDHGVQMRTTNHWGHHRKIPRNFYDGTTGIDPIDNAIERILETGYCHHIERLMVLGGFMFLCEFDPDEIYRWFMEMFVDSYDWVMVPNAYSMSQHADGGLITTKPYFSGSAYIRKMSHYPTGPWCDVWDGLYWRWIWNHCDELAKNPRWAMMCSMVKKMDTDKRNSHLKNATRYLESLES